MAQYDSLNITCVPSEIICYRSPRGKNVLLVTDPNNVLLVTDPPRDNAELEHRIYQVIVTLIAAP